MNLNVSPVFIVVEAFVPNTPVEHDVVVVTAKQLAVVVAVTA